MKTLQIKQTLARAWREDEGVLTFEWILLLTLLVIGIVSGLSTVRDAIIDELTDVAFAAVSFDQSFSVDAFEACGVTTCAFGYVDEKPPLTRCERGGIPGQETVTDCGG